MRNRRDFLLGTGATALSSVLPASLVAETYAQLDRRPIPGTGEMLPVVGLGNSRAFGSGDLPISNEILDIFMNRGGGYVDTSGHGRHTVGTIMQERNAHDQLFLGTYLGSTDEAQGLEEIRMVRGWQGGKPLDLLHTRNVNDFENNNDKYQRWKEEGHTRYLGVARSSTEFYEQIMRFMDSAMLDIIQVNYSLLEPEAAERVLPMARDKGIAVVINRPFINGQFFPVVKGHELPEWAADFDCESWAQFSLKYILSHPAINCVLTETSNPKHAIDNLGAGSGRLPDEATRRQMLKVMQDLS